MPSDKKRWGDLSPTKRRAIITFGVLDVALRAWALADLAQRPQDQVRGSKSVWAVALAVVSSIGILPGAYLTYARRAD